jgi:hypothetical protein
MLRAIAFAPRSSPNGSTVIEPFREVRLPIVIFSEAASAAA